jgi:hypothetical protein
MYMGVLYLYTSQVQCILFAREYTGTCTCLQITVDTNDVSQQEHVPHANPPISRAGFMSKFALNSGLHVKQGQHKNGTDMSTFRFAMVANYE